jgi:hypothetical protein
MLTPIQREHLKLIQAKEGNLRPEEVLRDARNPNSPLHDLFEWDNTAAANAYRLMQAKQVVRFVVRIVPQPRREAVRVSVAQRPVGAVSHSQPPAREQALTLPGLIAGIEAMKVRYCIAMPELESHFDLFIGALRQRAAAAPAPTPKPHFPGDDRASNGTLARFKTYSHNEAHTNKETAALRAGHPALTESRTQFPTRVFDPAEADHVLVPGHNNAKVGDFVTKGPWAGMNIFTLTLEERATCPDSCDLLAECYGNAMPLAKRWKYGPDLITKLHEELHALAGQHPAGFVVRLHVLGDFPDIEYVRYWIGWMADIPQIHIFGYTAHSRFGLIGQEIAEVNKIVPDRWAIRFSVSPDTEPMPMQATTIWRKEAGKVDEGVVCPASSGDTSCCGTCGLCWSPAFAGKRVVFLGHGMNRTKGGRPPAEINPALAAVVAAHKDVVISAPAVATVDLRVNPDLPRKPGSPGPNQGPESIVVGPRAPHYAEITPVAADLATITKWVKSAATDIKFRDWEDLRAVNARRELMGLPWFKRSFEKTRV